MKLRNLSAYNTPVKYPAKIPGSIGLLINMRTAINIYGKYLNLIAGSPQNLTFLSGFTIESILLSTITIVHNPTDIAEILNECCNNNPMGTNSICEITERAIK
jgi:hypothetical protein